MQTQLVQYFVTSLFHDFRTWVHVFVSLVTEAHQAVLTLFHLTKPDSATCSAEPISSNIFSTQLRSRHREQGYKQRHQRQ